MRALGILKKRGDIVFKRQSNITSGHMAHGMYKKKRKAPYEQFIGE